MNPPLTKANFRRRGCTLGGLAGLVCGVMILAGCTTDSKQKWLTFFFDGVPQPGATNAVVAPDTHRPAATNAVSGSPAVAPPPRFQLDVHPPYANRDCTACHESQFSQKMLGKPGDVCFTCHKDFRLGMKVKHDPVEAGECTS